MKEEIRKTYYENGNVETERSYVNDLIHGNSKGWYDSGELEFEGDSGGSYEIKKWEWHTKLSEEDEKEFEENDISEEILEEWMSDERYSCDCDTVFEDGCIEEIEVTLNDVILKLINNNIS